MGHWAICSFGFDFFLIRSLLNIAKFLLDGLELSGNISVMDLLASFLSLVATICKSSSAAFTLSLSDSDMSSINEEFSGPGTSSFSGTGVGFGILSASSKEDRRDV